MILEKVVKHQGCSVHFTKDDVLLDLHKKALPQTKIFAPENGGPPGSLEIPIGNHHFEGEIDEPHEASKESRSRAAHSEKVDPNK